MHKLWRVAKYEFVTHVEQKSFLIATLSVPVILALIFVIVAVVGLIGKSDLPFGIVDPSGVITSAAISQWDALAPDIVLQPYDDETAARTALSSGDIQAIFLLPVSYPDGEPLRIVAVKEAPRKAARGQISELLSIALLKGESPDVQDRILEGAEVSMRLGASDRVIRADQPIAFLAPLVAGILLVFATLATGGLMLQAVSTEKENRTVEVLVSSLSARQLIAGKAVGLLSLSLVQLMVWGLSLGVSIYLAGELAPSMRGFTVGWDTALIFSLFFLPTFALASGVMLTIGSMTTDLRQAQQMVGLVNLFFLLPIFAASALVIDPNHGVLVALSFLPTTSMVTLLMRWPMTHIPVWQIGISWVIVVGSAAASIWLAVQMFRLGMLRYGQPLKLLSSVRGLVSGHTKGHEPETRR